MKKSYTKKSYSKSKKSKKVSTKPKTDSSVVKLQKQLNALTTSITKSKEVKQVDTGVFQATVSQIIGQGVGTLPLTGLAAFVFSPAIPLGLQGFEHQGDWINGQSIQIRLQVQNQLATINSQMYVKMDIFRMRGDPTSPQSPAAFAAQYWQPNYFYEQLLGTSPPLGSFSLIDTQSMRSTYYNTSQAGLKVFSKTLKIPMEQFGSAIGVKEYSFTIPLKNRKMQFISEFAPGALQEEYYVYFRCSTGNGGSDAVDPSYTKGLGNYGANTGLKIYGTMRLNYTDS